MAALSLQGPGGGPNKRDKAVYLMVKSYRPLSGRNNMVKIDPVKNYRMYGYFNVHFDLALKLNLYFLGFSFDMVCKYSSPACFDTGYLLSFAGKA
jgi:hypothetical protein